jgi:hypothetical protein
MAFLWQAFYTVATRQHRRLLAKYFTPDKTPLSDCATLLPHVQRSIQVTDPFEKTAQCLRSFSYKPFLCAGNIYAQSAAY